MISFFTNLVDQSFIHFQARNAGTDNREGGSELHPMLSPQSPSINLAQPQQQQQQPQPSGDKLDVNA